MNGVRMINENNVSDKDKMKNSIEDVSDERVMTPCGTKLLVMKAPSRQLESYSKAI